LVKVPVFARLGIADRPTHQTGSAVKSDLTSQIAQRSYQLYEQRGRQEGLAAQDWDQAEREIRSAEADR
ncbi:MAG TPA: DUF2934 domain-containing protein, partial [Rhodocyclaceae bacterium]|nr:DUF2934 domain-containing protein [Rhodocyclaceae bacterium]